MFCHQEQKVYHKTKMKQNWQNRKCIWEKYSNDSKSPGSDLKCVTFVPGAR